MPGFTSQLGLGSSPRVISLPAGLTAWLSTPQVLGPRVATASGAMTAGTWKTVLSVTNSPGALRLFMAQTTNGAAKSLSVRITRDGVVVLNAASNGTSPSSGSGICAYGNVIADSVSSQVFQASDLVFDSSLLIEVQTSAAETDGWNFLVNYDLRA